MNYQEMQEMFKDFDNADKLDKKAVIDMLAPLVKNGDINELDGKYDFALNVLFEKEYISSLGDVLKY